MNPYYGTLLKVGSLDEVLLRCFNLCCRKQLGSVEPQIMQEYTL